MIRIECAESSPSRRTEPPPKQKPSKRPSLLKRLWGKRAQSKPQPTAKHETHARCPSLADQEMLIV
jgi:hypothetical protein